MTRFSLIISLLVVAIYHSNAQKTDSLPARRNTIKLNLVSSLLYSNSAALSYERTISANRSWGVMLGYVQFPQLGTFGPSMTTSSIRRNSGLVVGGEYRFYLATENKHRAPHGVYIGPYANYFNFSNERLIKYTTMDGSSDEGTLRTDISILNVGAQLGYQFVIKDRWTFDFVFIGPSLSQYTLDLSVDGFDQTAEGAIGDKILTALTDRFPIIKDLVGDQKVDVNGITSKWGTGFRYQMNIGYHFGRKKAKG